MADRVQEMRDYLVSKGWDPVKAQLQAERSQRRLDQSAATTATVAGMGLGAPAAVGEAASASIPAMSAIRSYLARRFAPSAAQDAVLMEPVAGSAAREAITRSTMMTPQTAGATIAAGAPSVLSFLPRAAEGDTGANTPLLRGDRGYEGDSPRERIAVTTANDILARQREAADAKYARDVIYNEPVRTSSNRPAAPVQQQQSQPAPSGATVSDLWAIYNKTGEAGDFVRADQAARAAGAYKDLDKVEGKKAGGSVGEKPQKDAAIHKALEIIHHLLTRG